MQMCRLALKVQTLDYGEATFGCNAYENKQQT
jgi:hypothetical protein